MCPASRQAIRRRADIFFKTSATHGTFVNEARVEQQVLKMAIRFLLAKTALLFTYIVWSKQT